jgi:predicted HAD superfamily Cof-like phosphohydrolase
MSRPTDTIRRLLGDRQTLVADNMRAMLQEVPSCVSIPSRAVLELRAKLMLEEVLETIAAMGVNLYLSIGEGHSTKLDKEAAIDFAAVGKVDLVEVLDGLCDLDYVGPCGTAVAFGFDMLPAFMEVHRSNMTKCWTDQEVACLTKDQAHYQVLPRPQPYDDDRRWVVLSANGKYIKSPSYSLANMLEVLNGQLALV